ncbi:MAG: alpha/beta hydrolase, partial [Bryobacterales bacterium]|nr:alpha/beta hydrolase [Bryobacterales bacterium]
FAALHPERVSSVTCLSCGVATSASAEQAGANQKGDLLKMIFRYNLYYWAVSKLFRTQFLGIMGVSSEVVASLTPEQLAIADQFIDEMNPVSLRSAGAAFDNQAAMPGARIAGIAAPTLIVHAKDDSLQLYSNAEFAVSRIPGAMSLHFEKGGHLVVVVEQDTIRDAVRKHILDHTGALACFLCLLPGDATI